MTSVGAVTPTARTSIVSIFLLNVLQHGLPHLDQTAPSILEKRNHLVDIGIARQLELWIQRT